MPVVIVAAVRPALVLNRFVLVAAQVKICASHLNHMAELDHATPRKIQQALRLLLDRVYAPASGLVLVQLVSEDRDSKS